MEYTGPASHSVLHMDLALSDEEGETEEHWPPLPTSPATEDAARSDASRPAHPPPSAAKRSMDDTSDSGSETHAPATKTLKHTQAHTSSETTSQLPPRDPPPTSSSALPAFAPRADYVKLAFTGHPSVETKLRWLAEVNKAFHLQRELAEVKMAAVTSRFVYVARCRQDIVERVTEGEFLSLVLHVQDSPVRSQKYPSYLVTRYPIGADPSLALELHGVHSARRFRQNGVPINRIVVTWSLDAPPPATISFSFLPCLPDCEIRRIKDEPSCYRCWGVASVIYHATAVPQRSVRGVRAITTPVHALTGLLRHLLLPLSLIRGPCTPLTLLHLLP